jgi:hypothetical protein
MRAVAALLAVLLTCALAQPPTPQQVTACQTAGTTCLTCTSRQISSDNTCGWCGNVTAGSTNGVCLSQSDYKRDNRLCLPNLPPEEGFRTGSPESACLPLKDLLELIRTIRIIIGVVVGVACLNAICTGIYVRRQRQGSIIQTVCWTAVGLVFPILSWFLLCFCGPALPVSQSPSIMMATYQGSAPPPSDSVVRAPPPFNPAYNPQQQQMYYPQQFPAQQQPPQQYLPPYTQPAPTAQPPPAYAYPAQTGTFYQSGSV